MQKDIPQIDNETVLQITGLILLNTKMDLTVSQIESLFIKLMGEYSYLFVDEEVDIQLIEDKIYKLIPIIKIERICRKLEFEIDNEITSTLVELFFTDDKYFTPRAIEILLNNLIKEHPEYLSIYNIEITEMTEEINRLKEKLPILMQERARNVKKNREKWDKMKSIVTEQKEGGSIYPQDRSQSLEIVTRIREHCKRLEAEWHPIDVDKGASLSTSSGNSSDQSISPNESPPTSPRGFAAMNSKISNKKLRKWSRQIKKQLKNNPPSNESRSRQPTRLGIFTRRPHRRRVKSTPTKLSLG